ncbi:MAG: hypothetical protein KDK55_02160 [Chlamydiia bacterium]|nr:hypothetical protein [Chlamydiia bacterium]
MKIDFFLLFIFFLHPLLLGQPEASFSKNKEKILNLTEELNKNLPLKQQGILYRDLAEAHYHDQELIRGYKAFLQALQCTSLSHEAPAMCEEEKKIYEEALLLYREEGGGNPICLSKKLCDHYALIGEEHPEYIHLNFLLSTAYANLGMYDRFFKEFYKGYPYFKETSLACKTQGILLIRLAQTSGLEEERVELRKEGIFKLERAVELDPNDSSLYKVLIYLAKEDKREACLIGYLEEVCRRRVKLSREEIYPYVKEAIFLHQPVLAEDLIDLWQTWYPYSRSIEAARKFLEQTKARG